MLLLNVKLHSQITIVYIPTNNTKWFKDSMVSCWWSGLTASGIMAMVAFFLWYNNKYYKNSTFIPTLSFSQLIWQATHLSHRAAVQGNNTRMWLLSIPYLSTNKHHNLYDTYNTWSTLHKQNNYLKVTSVHWVVL